MTAREERRSALRLLIEVPVRFRCFGFDNAGEIQTHTINISSSGVFFTSSMRLTVGSSLSMALDLPTKFSASGFRELRCIGRAIHEQRLRGEVTGYGVKIERMVPRACAPLPPAWNIDLTQRLAS